MAAIAAILVVAALVWLGRRPEPLQVMPADVAPKKIEIEYVGGDGCVELDLKKPEIWQDRSQNSAKPKKVKWVVKKEQENEYTWEFEYSPNGLNKPQGVQDWLGPVDPIACSGSQNTKSQKAPKDQGQDVTWPYEITVYECVNGAKGEELCVQDPVIWIRQ